MPVGGHLLGAMPHHPDGLREEPQSGVHIPALARDGVHRVAIAVDGPVQVAGAGHAPARRSRSRNQPVPALPRRLARGRSVSSGVPPARGSPASHSRAASWVKTMPCSRSMVARFRKLIV